MTKPPIYVARKIPEVGLELLRQQTQLRLHEGNMPPTREELLRGIAGCVGILSLLSDRIDSEVFDAAGSDLKVVSNFAVGTNNIDIAEAERRGIAVGNTPDVLTDATADIAVSLLLAVARRMKQGERDVEGGQWKTWEPRGWIGLDLAERRWVSSAWGVLVKAVRAATVGRLAVENRLYGSATQVGAR